MVVAGCGGGVAEAQWDCGNAMMGYASRQCGSRGYWVMRVVVESHRP